MKHTGVRRRLYGKSKNTLKLIFEAVNQKIEALGDEELLKILLDNPIELTKKLEEIKEAKAAEFKQGRHHAKIFVFDIETAPLMANVWGIWQQNIGTNMDMLKNDWFMLTWAGKWLFEDKVYSAKLTKKEALKQDDKRITKQLWHIMNEADIVIAHNGVKFDIKRINTRFLKHELGPTLPYQVIDTLLHARKHLAITSNKLDYIGEFLEVGRKLKHSGWKLWDQCVKGNTQALAEMERYNIQDIYLLEDVYFALRPFIKPHPNIGLYVGENVRVCPSCGSENIEWSGTYATYANMFDAFRCKNCLSIGRSRNSTLDKEAKRFLTLSTPK